MRDVFFIQQNFAVGDIAGNKQLILAGARAAAAAGAAVAVAPELALTGYPAEDYLYYPAFAAAVEQAVTAIACEAPPQLALVFGVPQWRDGCIYNTAALVRGGRVEATYAKTRLPNSSVFDDARYFTPAKNLPLMFAAAGQKYVLQICEDIWHDGRAEQVAAVAADNTLVLNGSPFVEGKHSLRLAAAATFARTAGSRVFYANMIGGYDELVYDGASFVADRDGALLAQLPAFTAVNAAGDGVVAYPSDNEAVYAALTLGLRDYFSKSGFADGVLLGLSGGVDSALVAALAVDALGAAKVTAVMLPTEYTSAASLEDAAQLAQNLGITYLRMPINDAVAAAGDTVAPHLRFRADDTTKENIQSRMRGLLLMALANNHNLLLLATGNKSEIAYGYATLYGDMNGGFAPIKDVLKTRVWDLCRWRNHRDGGLVIPARIIERAPSAELRPDQTDQDTLPPYKVIDAMLQAHLQRQTPAKMSEQYGENLVTDFYRRLVASEFKRRQGAMGTKISECAFGRDWRMPVASRYRYD